MLGTWAEGLAALQKDGVQLDDAGGGLSSYPVKATDDPGDCYGAALALVLVKAWQTERAARQLAECLSPESIALSLQNGLGNREILTKYLGDQRVGLGVIISRQHGDRLSAVFLQTERTRGYFLARRGRINRERGQGTLLSGRGLIQWTANCDQSVPVAPGDPGGGLIMP